MTGPTAGRRPSACEAILNAAEQLMGSHGFHATSGSALRKKNEPTGTRSSPSRAAAHTAI